MHSKIWTDMFVLALPVAEKILRPDRRLSFSGDRDCDWPASANWRS